MYCQKYNQDLKPFLIQIEIALMKKWNLFIKRIYDMIEQEDQLYLNLINTYDQKNQYLELLRDNCFNQLDKVNEWLKEEIDKFIQIIHQKLQKVLQNEKWQKCQGLEEYNWKQQKSEFYISFTKNNEIHYLKNGEILQIYKFHELETRVIKTNLEEIKHLKWIGKFQNNIKKVGLWTATWKGEALLRVGGLYLQNGKKQGKWSEQFKNFSEKAKVIEVGDYEDDQRIGTWRYIYEDKNSGGGVYNIQGQKEGKWIELSERFRNQSLVTYCGYYKNGIKVGRWDIFYANLLMGGGSYDEERQIKIGKWIELSEGFSNSSQISYVGEYKNNQKIRRWDTLFQAKQKGGGSYDNETQIKIGKWIELSEGFSNSSQVFFIGEYKNGYKVNKWDIWFQDQDINSLQLIGSGSYDKRQMKIGKWIELSDGFHNNSQVFYVGEYKNGQKVGRWDITAWRKQIGGGLYDNDGQFKNGQWIEVDDKYKYLFQVTYNGEYKNGQKVGKWDIFWNWDGRNQQIGGGFYDEKGQIKIGKWIEQSEFFKDNLQITQNGEYQNGQKIGRWNICLKDQTLQKIQQIGGGLYAKGAIKIGWWTELNDSYENSLCVTHNGEYENSQKVGRWYIQEKQNGKKMKIGGGFYNDFSMKYGKWVELIDDYRTYSSITFIGEYDKNGLKVGVWDTWFRHSIKQKYKLMQIIMKIGQKFRASGIYNVVEGQSKKSGRWIELSEGFNDSFQLIFNGIYKNGEKIGNWDIFYKQNYVEQFQWIGGGLYDDEEEIKIGKWVELSDGFQSDSQVTYSGDYKNNKKVGRWNIFCRNQQIGGGEYDEGGSIKVGRWIEESKRFRKESQVTYTGEYKNGIKFGRWDIMFDEKVIGGGSYDEQSQIKVGRWIELSDGFCKGSQVIYSGQYENDKKVGTWDVLFENKLIGGGSYDEIELGSFKVGKWVELSQGFWNLSQITYIGEYNNNGQKIGKWMEFDIKQNLKCKDLNY